MAPMLEDFEQQGTALLTTDDDGARALDVRSYGAVPAHRVGLIGPLHSDPLSTYIVMDTGR
ncbi:hypothetical protein [Streptomyces sp. JNUCC 63]